MPRGPSISRDGVAAAQEARVRLGHALRRPGRTGSEQDRSGTVACGARIGACTRGVRDVGRRDPLDGRGEPGKRAARRPQADTRLRDADRVLEMRRALLAVDEHRDRTGRPHPEDRARGLGRRLDRDEHPVAGPRRELLECRGVAASPLQQLAEARVAIAVGDRDALRIAPRDVERATPQRRLGGFTARHGTSLVGRPATRKRVPRAARAPSAETSGSTGCERKRVVDAVGPAVMDAARPRG